MFFRWLSILLSLPQFVHPSSDYCFHGNTEQQCLYDCHCKNNEPCGSLNGTCPSGCDTLPQDATWHGPGCQKGIISLGKPTFATYNDAYSSVCVDGINTGSVYCYVGPYSQEHQYWLVDLEADYVVEWVNLHPAGRYDVFIILLDKDDNEIAVKNWYSTTWFYGKIARKVQIKAQRTASVIIHIREVSVYGYRFNECKEQGDGTFYWGPGCLNECTGCAEQCNYLTGGDCTKCKPGHQGTNCRKICRKGWWGEQCKSSCNCDDDTEVCDRATGDCPVSGCPAWYIDHGCDYLLPMMSDETRPQLHAVGTAVKVAFIQWDPSMGGTSDMVNYRLSYKEVGTQAYTWLTGRLKHEDTREVKITNVTMPTANAYYFICVVPIDVRKDRAGKQSPCAIVYTHVG